MNKSILTLGTALCLSLLLFISCGKDEPTPPVTTDPNQFTDARDGKTYKTVTIGTQTWMAQSLNYRGPFVAGDDTCMYNLSENCTTYGALYTWDAANSIAPAGWHLPSDEEWKVLEKYLGMSAAEADGESWRGTDEGTKVKVGGSSGLNLQISGFYQSNLSSFNEVPGRFWTSTLKTGSEYYSRNLTETVPNNVKIGRIVQDKNDMNSVRCIKN